MFDLVCKSLLLIFGVWVVLFVRCRLGKLPGIGLELDRLDLFDLIVDEHELPQVGA